MKTTLLIMAIVTGLLIFSTTICGLWIRYSGEEIVQSSLNFHLGIGITTGVFTTITLLLAMITIFRLSA